MVDPILVAVILHHPDDGNSAEKLEHAHSRIEPPTRFQSRIGYGDLCTGEVRRFAFDVAAQTVRRDRSTGLKLPRLSSFGVGVNGKLYAAQIGGTVSRLEPGD